MYLMSNPNLELSTLSHPLSAETMSIIDKDTVWVEIGPHPTGCGLLKATLTQSFNVAVPSFRKGEDNYTTLAQGLGVLHEAGLQIRWNEFHRPFEKSLRLLELPTYSWNDKTYWIQYNGDWALTKGNTFYDAEKAALKAPATQFVASELQTSTVQRIVEENFEGVSGKVVMQSDLMQPEFLAAAHGHSMNGCGVVTSSIHADIAYTLGQYLHTKLVAGSKNVDMNIANLVVVKGLVAQKNTKTPQLIQVSATTSDISSGVVDLAWYNVAADGSTEEPFATANIFYGDKQEWLASWSPLTHLIDSRIEALKDMARDGEANRFSNKMAYDLFAKNLVDYAQKYRGMQSVVLHEFEGCADVTLSKEKAGTWTVPPFFIDSVAHLAGFIMNVSDASDTANTFCVTPGWRTMRFAKPLVAGEKYRSYVKMIQSSEDPTTYFGDVYVLQGDAIVGLVEGIQFRRYPRILLNRFFSPPDSAAAKTTAANPAPAAPVQKAASKAAPPPKAAAPAHAPKAEPAAAPAAPAETESAAPAPATTSAPAAGATPTNPDLTSVKAIALIAEEAGMEFAELTDDATFANIGVDSLMSLVISEKFRDQLGIAVASSLFLEYPSIGALRAWLEEYYN